MMKFLKMASHLEHLVFARYRVTKVWVETCGALIKLLIYLRAILIV